MSLAYFVEQLYFENGYWTHTRYPFFRIPKSRFAIVNRQIIVKFVVGITN